jgi:hypothetical protein
VLRVVAPVFIEASLGAPDTFMAVWVEVKLHFVPEPGLLLLGRNRMRK